MTLARVRITIEGVVQGVGFRPLVYRIAHELKLSGWVRNEGSRVLIEAQGERAGELAARVQSDAPSHARIESVRSEMIGMVPESGFRIVSSTDSTAPPQAVPDIVTCPDCLSDVLDPQGRFFNYPFTNCSQCGPRYSIIERVPYDRANTTMAGFTMCDECRAEFESPGNRRFHAQPTACPKCGPRLELFADSLFADPLSAAVDTLARGRVLALKGLGGFQLLVDATTPAAIQLLRRRKLRPDKPFAVMVRDLQMARELCFISEDEAQLLQSAAGPIVLLAKRDQVLPPMIAPDHKALGLLLPSTPLHHLLLRNFGRPVICTSGNLSEEPICIDNDGAIARLGPIADLFLLHDRPIRRPVDDSVARVIDGAAQVLRAGRGYAPVMLPLRAAESALAVGPHLKNTVALCTGQHAVVSQHVGDLENTLSLDAMRCACEDLKSFFSTNPTLVARDAHPDYASGTYAAEQQAPTTSVLHHLAHALACMLEHELHGPLLAAVWDGSGLGTDHTIWGGEFLRVERTDRGVLWSRVASLRPFLLPSGDAGARDARLALAGLLWEVPELHDRIEDDRRRQFERKLHTTTCTSAGRLFDAFAALLNLCGKQTYEGQAASRLEAIADPDCSEGYALPFEGGRLDWRAMLRLALHDQAEGVSAQVIAARFHHALADGIVEVSRAIGESTVVLTGGCFQNRLLTELAVSRLRAAGITPVIPRRLPPNDGGVSAGQLVAAVEGVTDVSRGAGQD